MKKKTTEKKIAIRRYDLFMEEYNCNLGDIIPAEIGLRFEKICENLDCTIQELAHEVNVSKKGLEALTLGKGYIPAELLLRLNELKVDIVWLLYGEHTAHMDLMTYLFAASDLVKIEIFSKMKEYFLTGNFDELTEYASWENVTTKKEISFGTQDEIRERLKNFRESRGIILDEMAKNFDISCSGYRKNESEQIYGRVLFLLHDIFGIDVVWLLSGFSPDISDIFEILCDVEEKEIFDAYVRLYSYLGTRKFTALTPYVASCEGIEHFAKWDSEKRCYVKK